MRLRETTLGEAGDLTAQPGSYDWSVAARLELQGLIKDTTTSAEHLEFWLAAMESHQGYQQITDGQGRTFPTFEAFCIAAPPFGLGYSRTALNAIVRERKSAKQQAETAEPLAQQGRPEKTLQRNVIAAEGLGNGANYLTRRIARDHPAILERMKAGLYRSVRAAALEAGIVHPTVTVPLDPDRAARILAKHFDHDQMMRLLDCLARLMPPE